MTDLLVIGGGAAGLMAAGAACARGAKQSTGTTQE